MRSPGASAALALLYCALETAQSTAIVRPPTTWQAGSDEQERSIAQQALCATRPDGLPAVFCLKQDTFTRVATGESVRQREAAVQACGGACWELWRADLSIGYCDCLLCMRPAHESSKCKPSRPACIPQAPPQPHRSMYQF